jgi:hypothetical protein
MKPSELTNGEKMKVLELKASGKSYDYIVAAEEGGIHRNKRRVMDCVEWFKYDLSWEEAKAYCGNDLRILGLREDYLEQSVAETEKLKARLENERKGVITGLVEQNRGFANQIGVRYINPLNGAMEF